MPTLEQLSHCVARGMAPDAVLRSIGEGPLVNTFAMDNRVRLEWVDLSPTPGQEAYFSPLAPGDRAVYWRQADSALGVEIIGIVWDAVGAQRVLAGTILAP
jgi:hypothetical protein